MTTATLRTTTSKSVEEAKGPLTILFFSHYFPPEGNAPANRTHQNCRIWAAQGHRPIVITCAPNCPDGVVYEGYRNRWLSRETIDGIEVFRVWTWIAKNAGFAPRIANYVSYMLTATWRALLLRERPDVIVATSPQFFCGFAGVLAKWMLRRPLVLEIRDIWPESIVTVGAMKKSLVIRGLEVLERLMYRAADHIVTVGEGYKEQLLERGVPESKIEVVMNGVDAEVFHPRERDVELALRLGLDGKFVVTYAGTLGMAAGLEVVLRAAEKMRAREFDDVAFLLVGSGAERERLEAEARARGLDNVIFTGRLGRDDVPRYLSITNAAFIHLKKSDLFRTVIPSKIFEAGGMGLPIIIGVEGKAAALVARMGAGIAIEPESEDALIEAILKLKADRTLSANLGRAGHEHVMRHCERRVLAGTMLKSLEREASRKSDAVEVVGG